jgi:hypothetical protein
MLEHLKELPVGVKRVLLETILAEQEHLDLDRPRGVKDRIKDVIEREARSVEAVPE